MDIFICRNARNIVIYLQNMCIFLERSYDKVPESKSDKHRGIPNTVSTQIKFAEPMGQVEPDTTMGWACVDILPSNVNGSGQTKYRCPTDNRSDDNKTQVGIKWRRNGYANTRERVFPIFSGKSPVNGILKFGFL